MNPSAQTRLPFSRPERLLMSGVLLLWLVCWFDWTWTHRINSPILLWSGMILGLLAVLRWGQWLLWPTRRGTRWHQAIAGTVAFLVLWQFARFLTGEISALSPYGLLVSRSGISGLFLIGLGWVIAGMERYSPQERIQEPAGRDLAPDLKRFWWFVLLFPAALPIWAASKAKPIRTISLAAIGLWLFAAAFLYPVITFASALVLDRAHLGTDNLLLGVSLFTACSPVLSGIAIAVFPASWAGLVFQPVVVQIIQPGDVGLPLLEICERIVLRSLWGSVISVAYSFWLRVGVALGGMLLTWGGWKLWRKSRYLDAEETYVWNPFHPRAWYYGQRQQKLNQSISGLLGYTGMFVMGFLLITNMGGCQEIYESPLGGGEQQPIAQVIQIKKIIKKKYIINPFSHINIKIPKIDEIQLNLNEVTRHVYTVGYGQGVGAGFAGGSKNGKVRFIRLEYSGGDWDQDFGVGADLNMLLQYGIRTSQKVEDKTESRTVAQLDNFPLGKSPPMVFMTGQKNISLSRNEVKILREYLIDKHGMLFCDNGGSGHFHNQFLYMMREVLPNVRPVKVPLDDRIHSLPYKIPFLPYVAPHGGKDALGWKVDGRWVAYYHPGDIGDAWADGHAGVKPEIWEACYQLGTNVIFYAHTEYSKWLSSQEKK